MGRIPVLPSDIVERRLHKATNLLDEICANPGKASLHRANMRMIEIQVDLSGMAMGDFLDTYFRKKYSPAPVAETPAPMLVPAAYTCAGCKKTFDNPKAFQGHGQSRCLQKRAAAAAAKA
jgi:hypothetical protein